MPCRTYLFLSCFFSFVQVHLVQSKSTYRFLSRIARLGDPVRNSVRWKKRPERGSHRGSTPRTSRMRSPFNQTPVPSLFSATPAASYGDYLHRWCVNLNGVLGCRTATARPAPSLNRCRWPTLCNWIAASSASKRDAGRPES